MQELILVVDDTVANRQYLVSILGEAGYRVRAASSGKLALRAATHCPPDMILLDIRMPEMDGFEVCKKLKETPLLADIPVIFLSALTEPEDKATAFNLGGVDFITKPFNSLETLARIATHLSVSRLRRELVDANTSLEKKVKERTTELVESENRLRAIVENAPVVLWVVSRTGQLKYVTPNIQRLCGYSGENMNWREHIKPEDIPAQRQSWQGLLDGEGGYDIEYRVQKPDGQWIWIHERAAEKNNVDSEALIYGVSFNITRRKELEEHLRHAERMEVTGQLAAGIGHDFNNLLWSIIGGAELLLDNPDEMLSNTQRISMILTAANRAAELAQQLLVLGRKSPEKKESVVVGTLLESTSNLLVHALEKKINVIFDLKCSSTILADASALQNVLLNLGVNARDAMPEGGTLYVSCYQVAAPPIICPLAAPVQDCANWVCIEFTDTGSGIGMEVLDHIFEPYYTTKGEGKGTGLGLANAYTTIKNHDGAIDVRSKLGAGTSFFIYLPGFSDRADSSERRSVTSAAGSGRILVVDDEPELRVNLIEGLRIFGYEVIAADNGQEAVEIFRQQGKEIDLVLMDMSMPVMNGLEATREILNLNRNAKIVLTSGMSREDNLDRILQAGAIDLLEKGKSLTKMLKQISEYF